MPPWITAKTPTKITSEESEHSFLHENLQLFFQRFVQKILEVFKGFLITFSDNSSRASCRNSCNVPIRSSSGNFFLRNSLKDIFWNFYTNSEISPEILPITQKNVLEILLEVYLGVSLDISTRILSEKHPQIFPEIIQENSPCIYYTISPGILDKKL